MRDNSREEEEEEGEEKEEEKNKKQFCLWGTIQEKNKKETNQYQKENK